MDILGIVILAIISASFNNLVFTTIQEEDSFSMYMVKTTFSLALSFCVFSVLFGVFKLLADAGEILCLRYL